MAKNTTADRVLALEKETGDLQSKFMQLEADFKAFQGWMDEHINVLQRRVTALERPADNKGE